MDAQFMNKMNCSNITLKDEDTSTRQPTLDARSQTER